MDVYHFLAALPALLALGGFVLYQLLWTNKSGDELTKRIVDKLRQEGPATFTPDQRLNATQVMHVLKGSQRLQQLVGNHDFLLLQQALRQQFITSLFVYALATGFCALSVILFFRQSQERTHLKIVQSFDE